MLSDAVLVGLASFYLYYLIAQATILDRPLGGLRERFPMLVGCPWCLGFWLTGGLLLVSGNYDPVTHLAASTVVGVVGALTL